MFEWMAFTTVSEIRSKDVCTAKIYGYLRSIPAEFREVSVMLPSRRLYFSSRHWFQLELWGKGAANSMLRRSRHEPKAARRILGSVALETHD